MRTEKQACEREPFTLDWSDFYTRHGLDPVANPITSSTWAVTAGTITTGADFIDPPETTIFIEGGVAGEDAAIKNTIEIGDGTYRTCRTLNIEVK